MGEIRRGYMEDVDTDYSGWICERTDILRRIITRRGDLVMELRSCVGLGYLEEDVVVELVLGKCIAY